MQLNLVKLRRQNCFLRLNLLSQFFNVYPRKQKHGSLTLIHYPCRDQIIPMSGVTLLYPILQDFAMSRLC